MFPTFLCSSLQQSHHKRKARATSTTMQKVAAELVGKLAFMQDVFYVR